TLRDSQQMTENTLAAIAQALREGNPSPVMANREKLAEIAQELRALMSEGQQGALVETPIHGYVWLSMELAQQLASISQLICRALRK
ncbi:FUSC family protein, partial [Leptospira borgpetersenii serovar Ballum]|nr:FUSC family protein [Leptospira borgpetersenii serovar Ballum]